jgi:hypothetical protein
MSGASLCARPNGMNVGLAYSSAGRLDIFGADAQWVRAAEVPFASAPVFVRNRLGELSAARPRYWYGQCTATNQRIFVLFSGRLTAAFSPTTDWAADYVHVFDWDGKLQRVLHLDRTVRNIAVDPQGRFLFASAFEDPVIVRYALP